MRLTSVTIPDTVTTLGEQAFASCSKLGHATIGSGVTSFGKYAFQECTSLETVTIKDGVKNIGVMAFYKCSKLGSVVIPNSVLSIGNQAFDGCSAIKPVVIGNGVTTIGELAFNGCSSLEALSIGNSVATIGKQAFAGCSSLRDVVIPASTTSIGDNAFGDSVKNVTIKRDKTESLTAIGTKSFGTMPELIIVPSNSVSNYREETNWIVYKDVIFADFETCTAEFDSGPYVYNGGFIRPANIQVLDGTKRLTETTDYVISYGENTKVGTGSVTFTGINDYKGVITKTFDIAKKELKVYGLEVSDKTYDYSSIATATFDYFTGVIDGETVGLTVSAEFSSKNVEVDADKKVINKTVTVRFEITGADKGNYTVPDVITEAKILPKGVNVIGLTAQDKTYDGKTDAVATFEKLEDIVYYYDRIEAKIRSATFEDKNVGADKTVNIDFEVTGEGAVNFVLVYTLPTATISPIIITVSGTTVEDKIYDGSVTAKVTMGTYDKSGIISGDDVDVSIKTAVFEDKNVAVSGKEIVSKTVTVTYETSGDDKDNYVVTGGTVYQAKITPAKVSLVDFKVSDKVYDGTVNAAVTFSGLSGVIEPDDFYVEVESAAFDDKNIGTDRPVSINFKLSGADAVNYYLDYTAPTATVSPKELIINITEIDDKTYDGTASVETSIVSVDGKIDGDVIEVSIKSSAFEDKNVLMNGDKIKHKTVTVVYEITGDDKDNYAAPDTVVQAKIMPKGVGVIGLEASDKVYDGTTATTAKFKLLYGILDGDDYSAEVESAEFLTKDVGEDRPVLVIFKESGEDAANYDLRYGLPIANVTVKTLTVIGTAVSDKVYDGNASAKAVIGTVDGKADGDDLNVIIKSAAFDDKNVALNGKDVAKKNVTVVYEISGADVDNYTIEDEIIEAAINPALLDVVGLKAFSREYDGTTDAKAEFKELSGIIGSDDIIAEIESAAFEDKNVGTGKSVTVNFIKSGDDANNYTLAFDAPVADITKKVLTISGTVTKDKVYDGNVSADTTLGTVEGIIEGEDVDVEIVSSNFGDKNVARDGQEVVKKTVDIVYELTGKDKDNYSVDGGIVEAKILPAKLTVTDLNVNDKRYDGTTEASAHFSNFTGIIGSDNVQPYVQSANFIDKNVVLVDGVPQSKAVNVVFIIAGDDNRINYYADGGDVEAVITPATLDVAVEADDKVYDGTTDATVTITDVTGIIDGDDVSVDIGSAEFEHRNVSSNQYIAVKFLLSGDDAVNYKASYDRSKVTASITAREVTVEGTVVKDKTYDGTVSAEAVLGKVIGIVEGDYVKVVIKSATFADKDVAMIGGEVVDKPVTVVYELDGYGSGNYTIGSEVLQAKILPVKLSIIDLKASDKVYDGTTAVEVTHSGLSGVIGTEDVSVSKESAAFEDKKAGTDKTVNAVFKLSGKDAANYVLDYDGTLKATIEKRELTVSGTVVDDKDYDGNVSAEATVGTVDGLIKDDDAEVIIKSAAFSDKDVARSGGEIVKKSVAIEYGITGADSENYTVADVTAEAKINPAKLVALELRAVDKTYNGTTDGFAIFEGISGVIGTEDVTAEVASATFADKNVAPEIVVTIVFALSGEDSSNYVMEDVQMVSYISERLIDFTSASDTKAYDGTPLTNDNVIVGGDGFVEGEGATFYVTGSQTEVGTSKNTFTYKMNEGTLESNYQITKIEEGDLTVTIRTVVLTSASETKPYDGTSLTKDEVIVGGDGFMEGEGATFDVTGSQTNVGTSKNTFTYKLNEGTSEDNYIITVVEGDLTVTKRSIIMTSASDSKLYDGTALTNSGVTLSGDGFMEGEGAEVTATGSQISAGSSKNTISYKVNEGTLIDNYEFIKVEGDLTVIVRSVLLTSASASKVYDSTPLTDDTVIATGDGFIKGEGAAITVTGSQTSAGISKNTFTYKLNKGTSADNYVIQIAEGDLTVTARSVVMTSALDSKKYDGTPLTNSNVTVTGDGFVAGEGATQDVTGSQTSVGSSKNAFTYTLNEGTSADNYEIDTAEGDLVVTPRSILLTSASDFQIYNGIPLANSNVIVSGDGFADGEGASYDVTGSQTAAGASKNTFTYELNEGTSIGNYVIETAEGDLVVSQRSITLTSASDSKVYDGSPLSNSVVSVTGDGFADGEGASYDVTGSQFIAGSSANVFSYTLNEGTDAGNYAITKEEGTLTVTPITSKMTITADSASKKYDGTALTKDTFSYTDGILASGDELKAVISGMITDFGIVDNIVDSYMIMHGDVDVTGCYSSVEIVKGVLEITKRSVILTTASDSKTYDGTILTNDAVTVSGDGFVDGEGATYTVTGSQFAAGTSANAFTYELNDDTKADNYDITKIEGTLTVKTIDDTITITAGSDSKKYDGKSLTKDTFSYTDGVIISGDELKAVISGTITDFGIVDNIVDSYTIMHGDVDVTGCYSNVVTVKGTLEITKRSVTLTSASDSKTYDGTALTNSTVTVSGDGFVDSESATYTVTGSQFAAGTSANAFTYTLNDDTKADNYDITKIEGTLTVKTIDDTITITAGSDSKKYDGEALTKDTFSYTDGVIISGDELKADIFGEITDAGTAENTVAGYKIMHGEIDVTGCYSSVVLVKGTLEITKRSVTLTSASDSKAYDRTPLTNDTVTVSGDGFIDGEGATYGVTGSQTNVGTSKNTFTYTLNEGTSAVNYDIQTAEGVLTVTIRTVILTSASDSKAYDGTPLTNGKVTVSGDGFMVGEGATFSVTGSQTDVGTSKNTFTYKLNEGTSAVNYIITVVEGDLTVTIRTVILTSASDSKAYDGTPLINGKVTVSGDGFMAGEGATFSVTGSQTSAGTSKNTFTYTLNEGTSAVNYDIQTAEGDLTVTVRSVIMTSPSGSKVYDSTPLTNENIIVSGDGFAAGEGAAFTVTGSQTDVGSSKNTFTYKLNEGTSAVNYDIQTAEGDLTVTVRSVIMTSASDSKVYNGTPLTNAAVTVTGDGFAAGESASYDVTGSQTSAGSSKNTFTYKLNEGTSAVNYDIQTVEGDLTVEKADQTITISKSSSCPAGFNLGAKVNEDASLSYSVTTGSDIISVDGEGNIVGKAVGNAKLEIKAAATDNYKAGAKTFDISIYDHIHVIVPGVAPTKTESGLTEGEECSECHKIFTEQKRIEPTGSDKTVIETKDTKAVFEVPDSEEVKTLTVKLEESTGSKYQIELSEESTSKVKDTTIAFSIEADKERNDTYKMVATSDGKEFTGEMNVTLPYDPSKGTPSVKWVEGDQKMDTVSTSESDKTVTFRTTHNSTYTVEYQTESSNDGTAIAIGAAAVIEVIAILALAYFVIRRKA